MEASLHTELGPTRIFHSLIPPAVLVGQLRPDGQPGYGRPPSIVPDATIDVALPTVDLGRQPRLRAQARPSRMHFFDTKTIHGGSAHYETVRAREDQSGAVAARAASVHTDYLRHARELDQRFSDPGTTPIRDRLLSYGDLGQVRALVFGQYGEASRDVHLLLSACADAIARRRWRSAGARSFAEYRGFVVAALRRRVGMAVVRAMARHRLHRVPFIGVPRAAVRERMDAQQRRQPRPFAAAAPPGRRAAIDPQEFYAHQVRIPVGA